MSKFIEPTKTNLIRLKADLKAALEGYEILDRKREILLNEYLARTAEYRLKSVPVTEKLTKLNSEFTRLSADMGPSLFAYATLPKKDIFQIDMQQYSIMGVKLPQLKISKSQINLCSAGEHSNEFNRISSEMYSLLPDIVYLAGAHLQLKRLKNEIDKTQKRLRALENIHIKQHRESIAYIVSFLEENDRDELVRYKKIKRKLHSEA